MPPAGSQLIRANPSVNVGTIKQTSVDTPQIVIWRLRQAASGGAKTDCAYSMRPETMGMRSFCFGLIMSSMLSLVMAALCHGTKYH